MAEQQPDSFPPPGWTADNLQQLRTVWNDLRPEADDKGVERRFRDRLLTPEQAGIVFERWVLEAFRLSGQTGHYPFTVPLAGPGGTLEQIDGLVFDGWQGFLLQSKFWTDKVDFGPIALLHAQVGTRPTGTLGLFFSAFGYTPPALQSTDRLQPVRVLLFDREDLGWVLAKRPFKGSMAELVRRKWMLAVKSGSPYLKVTTPIELFN
jgi:hypothetical protein